MDHGAAARAGLPQARQSGAGTAAALRGQDDGTEPGPGDAADRATLQLTDGEAVEESQRKGANEVSKRLPGAGPARFPVTLENWEILSIAPSRAVSEGFRPPRS